MYVKALPTATYRELEESFRGSNFSVYLIAVVSHGRISCRVDPPKDVPRLTAKINRKKR
jgi:hypothetical protein